MNIQFYFMRRIIRISLLVFFLLFMSGCASVKTVVRDATGILTAVMSLTDQNNGKTLDQLNAVEEHILDSCETLFISADHALQNEGIPVLVKLGALFNSRGCQRTVNNARQELDMISL